MQITIVQAEIESAIRKYIQEQIVIKDGMKIEIDLRATRGDAGFMATIDIVPSNTTSAKPAVQQQQQAQPEPKAEPVAMKTVTTAPAKQEAAAQVSQGKQEQPPVDNAHVAEGAQQFPEAGTASTEPMSTTNAPEAGEQPAESAAEAPKTRTLFTNLKRVNNG